MRIFLLFSFALWLVPYVGLAIAALWPAMPFPRIMNRLVMLLAVVSIWPLAKAWGVNSWRKLGLKIENFFGTMFRWMLVGMGMVLVLMILHAAAGALAWKWDVPWYKPLEFAASALAVGFMEELLFRGLLLQAIRHRFRSAYALWGWAMILSVIFASLHFLKFEPFTTAVDWSTGFQVWAQAWPSPAEWAVIFPRWFSLVWVGLILCAMTLRHGHIVGAIGLHAGWVFMLKFSDRCSDPRLVSPWFGAELYTGFIPGAVLVLIFIAVIYGRARIDR